MKVYIPSEISYDACVSIYDKDTLRVYESTPSNNSTSNFYDIFINNHYLFRHGTQTFNQYTSLPQCINSNNITDNVFYRNDISDILLVFFILLIICFYFPYKIISRLFGRWLKL